MKADDGIERRDDEVGPDPAAADVTVLVAQAMESVRKAVDELTALFRAHAPDAVAALKDAGKAAGDNIGDIAEDARDLGRARLDDLGAAVQRNPLSWLALAAGVGLIVGLWNGRGGRQ